MKIKKFEEIEAWQAARELVNLIYIAVSSNKRFKSDLRLVNQIQGAAVSAMANIAEGFSRQSEREFIQYLYISKGSGAEVQSHIYVALDQEYISKSDFNKIYDQADKVSRMNSNFIKYLKSQTSKKRGPMHTQ